MPVWNAISCLGFAPARSPAADIGSGFPGDFTAFTKLPLRGGRPSWSVGVTWWITIPIQSGLSQGLTEVGSPAYRTEIVDYTSTGSCGL